MDSKFTDAFMSVVRNEILNRFDSIEFVVPYGFCRFDGDVLDAIYVVVIYKDGHDGFVRYKVDSDTTIDSLYYEKDHREEFRFSPDGELICKYLHYNQEDEINVIKHKGHKYLGVYRIKNDDYRQMKGNRDLLVDLGIIDKEDDTFKCFDKENKVYLAIVTNDVLSHIAQGGSHGSARYN